jgi:hypothetical protein
MRSDKHSTVSFCCLFFTLSVNLAFLKTRPTAVTVFGERRGLRRPVNRQSPLVREQVNGGVFWLFIYRGTRLGTELSLKLTKDLFGTEIVL